MATNNTPLRQHHIHSFTGWDIWHQYQTTDLHLATFVSLFELATKKAGMTLFAQEVKRCVSAI